MNPSLFKNIVAGFFLLCITPCATYGQTFVKLPQTGGLSKIADTRGVSLADLDHNGYIDIYFSNRSVKSNTAHYNFQGILDTLYSTLSGIIANSQSSSLIDYNNDGYVDVYVAIGGGGNSSSSNSNMFLENTADSGYVSLTGNPVSAILPSMQSAWGDYDNDGFLDFSVANSSGYGNEIYRNLGNGTFSDQTGTTIPSDTGDSGGMAWCDFDNDGDLDLFVANRGLVNNKWYSQNSGVFTEITTGDLATDIGESFGVSFGDFDNDGYQDIFIANAAASNNFLYTNDGNGNFSRVTGINVVTDGGNSLGSSWGDLDNDGYIDLVVGNGSTLSGTIRQNFMYFNNGDGTFTKATNIFTTDQRSTTAVALGDIDKDGRLDIIAGSRDEENDIYMNASTSSNNFLCLNLEGVQSNRMAFGAKVKVKSDFDGNGSKWQYRHLLSTSGYGAQNSPVLHFGTGSAGIVDSMVVEWPSGQVCTVTNVPCNGFYYMKESLCALDTNLEALFTYLNSSLIVNFTDISKGDIVQYHWGFGDGDTSNKANPSHTYQSPGIYTVCLSVVDSYRNKDSVCRVLTLNCFPSISNFSSQVGSSPNIVQFTSLSTNVATYWWDFGDGSFSSQANPLKIYSSPGTYNVCLGIQDSCGFSDTTCSEVFISDISIDEYDALSRIAIYPNPIENGKNISIELPEGIQKTLVQLYSSSGLLLLDTWRGRDDLEAKLNSSFSKLQKGVYLLRIQTPNGKFRAFRLVNP